jgi:hypothetical protein
MPSKGLIYTNKNAKFSPSTLPIAMICAKNYPMTSIYDELLSIVDAARPGALFAERPGHKVSLFFMQQPPVDRGLLIHKCSRSHTTTHHSRQDSSGRAISSTHRPLPDNLQHSEQISMPPERFETIISTGERPHT